MPIYPYIDRVSLFGVYDRGVPDKERIVLQAHREVDTAALGLLVGFRQVDGSVIPMNDCYFWFGSGTLKATNWIHVHTGKGAPTSGTGTVTNEPIFRVFWGREKTIFDSPQMVPVLICVDTLIIDKHIFEEPESALPIPQSLRRRITPPVGS
jgi:hypothetical protein